jgi:hypothetical protein
LPDTSYYFVVRTHTPRHRYQQNDLWSDYSEEALAGLPGPAEDTIYLPILFIVE